MSASYDPERVVREHAPAVYRQLRRIFGPRADIDDVLQSALFEIVRWLPRFEGRAQLSTWIYRIVANVAATEMRVRFRLAREDGVDDAGALPGNANVHADVERKQATALLYEALQRVSPKKRIAIVLHDLEEMTLQEVADALELPLQTVASQVKSGRAELAEALHTLMSPSGGSARGRRGEGA